MRILFLDDMEIRHKAFLHNHPNDYVIQAFTAQQAIRALDSLTPFDMVYLDHDLAEEHYEADIEYGNGTGMDVVDHLIKMPIPRRPHFVVVHTFNERGREMLTRLMDANIHSAWRRFDPAKS